MKPAHSLPAAAAPLDDAVLVARVAAGDGAAFELLMRRYNQRLYRLARSMLRSSADAEDALQDAYLLAFRAMAGFRGEAGLATWLSRVVANECLGRLRRQKRRDNIIPMVRPEDDAGEEQIDMQASQAEGPDETLMRGQMRILLERKLDELPEAFRTVFVLRCVEELSVEETARCLDIPEATVRTRQFRARGMLRESLARDIDLAERDVFAFDGVRCDRIVAGVLEALAADAG